jgi:hypothetical protein
MNKWIKVFIIWTVVMPLAIIGSGYYMAYFHESVHVRIFQYNGIDSEVVYYMPWESPLAVTIPKPSNYTCDSSCVMSHSINEAIGYHLIGLKDIFIGSLLLYFTFKIIKNEK